MNYLIWFTVILFFFVLVSSAIEINTQNIINKCLKTKEFTHTKTISKYKTETITYQCDFRRKQ